MHVFQCLFSTHVGLFPSHLNMNSACITKSTLILVLSFLNEITQKSFIFSLLKLVFET